MNRDYALAWEVWKSATAMGGFSAMNYATLGPLPTEQDVAFCWDAYLHLESEAQSDPTDASAQKQLFKLWWNRRQEALSCKN